MFRSLLTASLLSSCFALPAAATELDIRIQGVANADGHVLVALYDSEDGWEGRAKARAAQRVAAAKGTLELSFAELAPGSYGVMVMHDENDNGKLDTNLLGIPREGYGFSNNPRLMRRAKFDEVAFDLPEQGQRIVIEMR